ncbi:MAG: DNA primase [bacterium]|nr:DNA primase [bacterium]
MDLKEAVLQRVDLVEFIGQYTALTQAGREWRGRCPFHQEKTGSFYVNTEKGLYHCHGCKTGGNAISFAMHVESLEFRDALEWLARRYNIPIPEFAPGSGTQRGEKQRLYELNDAAAAFYREQLRGPKGEVAREYLKKRGVSASAIADFDLGYAPNEWTALTDALLGKGAKAADLEKISLSRKRNEAGQGGGGYYDYFRNRLTFAIRDVTGRVIGFAARALSVEDQPKYLNVAGTPLYDKSRTLYNLDRAKGRLRDEGAVLVEGYMDVIGLAGAGVLNAVACCGTSLTEQHVTVLEKYTDRFYLAFDGDEAGRKAAWSSGVLLLQHGISAGVAMFKGDDPDDFIRKHGLEKWNELLAHTQHVVRVWLDHQLELHPDATPARINKWVGELAGLYRGLPNELIRQDFFKAIADGLQMDAATVGSLLGSAGTAARDGVKDHSLRAATPRGMMAAVRAEMYTRAMAGGVQPIEREVMRRLLTDEEFRFYYSALARPEWFASPVLRELYGLLAQGNTPEYIATETKYGHLVTGIMLAEPLADSSDQLLLRHNNLHLEREITRLTTEFRAASAVGDTQRENELMQEVLTLKKQIRIVSGLADSGYSPTQDERNE